MQDDPATTDAIVRPRRRRGWLASLLALVTLLTYAPSLSHDFTNYDDPRYVSRNPYVAKGLSARSVHWALHDTDGDYWHPFTSLSHVVVGHFFGTDPAAHHAANILLHTVNVLLVFAILNCLTGAAWSSAAVAALFGLHPLRVESVAWVTERSTVLAVFMSLLAIAAYVAYVRGSGPRAWAGYAALIVCLALALMTKPVAVTLPFVLLLLDYWPLRRVQPKLRVILRLVVEKLPLFLIVAAFTGVAIYTHVQADAFETTGRYTLSHRLGNAMVSYARYLGMTVWPVRLAVAYPHLRPWSVAQVVGAGLLVTSVSLLAATQWRRRPYLIVGWLWFLGTLVPVIGILQARHTTLADRYTYFPHIGLFVAAVWWAAEIARRRHLEGLFARGAVVVLLALAVRTVHQLDYWQNSTTLFSHAIEVDDENFLAHQQLGNELARANNLEGAEHHYRAALQVRPEHAMSNLNLGNVLARREQFAEAEERIRAALARGPKLAPAHLSLGYVLNRQQRFTEAEPCFAEALRLDPSLALAHYQWGVALRDQGKELEAANQFRAALQINPQLTDAQQALTSLHRPPTTTPLSATRPAL